MLTYDVTFPYIRMAAGPVDYTQGALRNAQMRNFAAVYSDPMSQGTRAHQVALYVIFDSPLTMLCDSPTAYVREQETTTTRPASWPERSADTSSLSAARVTAGTSAASPALRPVH